VHRHDDRDAEVGRRLQNAPAQHVDAGLPAEERLCGRRAEAYEKARADEGELEPEPVVARTDLRPVRRVVDPAGATRPPLEVLDGVRDVEPPLVETDLGQDLAQEHPGGADEGSSLLVLHVARLLADEHQAGAGRPLAEDGLRPVSMEIAASAVHRFTPNGVELPPAPRDSAHRVSVGGASRARRRAATAANANATWRAASPR
jgi:hypothetical protein